MGKILPTVPASGRKLTKLPFILLILILCVIYLNSVATNVFVLYNKVHCLNINLDLGLFTMWIPLYICVSMS